MRIGGVDPATLPTEEILVLPRGDKQIVFRARGVPDYDEFIKVCPEPKPPGVLRPNAGWVPNEDDPAYKDMVAVHATKKLAWLLIVSLEPSEIEWDKVDPSNPSTWVLWEDEMKAAGFNQMECNRIQNLVFEANCLNEEKISRARENFLLGQQPVPSEFSSPTTEPGTSQSGEPASE